MAFIYKTLGQLNPLAATLTDLYTVPASTTALITSLFIANRSSTATSFRLSVAVAGAVDNVKQYTHYDIPIAGNDSFSLDISYALGTADVVRCYATLATLSFSIFGQETT